MARAEFDRGEAPPSTEMSHVRLILARSPEQQAALDKYDFELQQKSSPNYHQWLTPEEFGKRYGPANSDMAAIVAWLESHGLQVDPVPPGRTNISFSGSVPQIEQLLHTSIHSFEANGEEFLSNTTNPKIPAALAGVVSGVARLNTIRLKPAHILGPVGMYDHDNRRMSSVSPGQSPRPALTHGSGTSADPYTLYLVAGDAATIYDTPNSFNAAFTTGTSYEGTGVTIGIGGQALIDTTIVTTYRNLFLGDTTAPTVSNDATSPATATTGGDAEESYLDTEIAGALAPKAAIHFYTASSIDIAVSNMVNDHPTVDIFSLSYGLCELGGTTADNQMFSGWWQQAATQGIAVTVSTGDNGSAGCDQQPQTGSGIATTGLMVSGLASTPYNIAVGGTDFAGIASAGAFTTYVSTTNGNLFRSAMKYIPESTWNDSTTVNTTISADVPVMDKSGNTNIVAGSGGASNCSTNTTTNTTIGACTSGYAKPTWQRGANVPADGVRDIPDISLMSGAGGDNAAWLVCTNDTFTGGITTDCTAQGGGAFYFVGFGGTSAASPAFAGILALVQNKTGSRLGLAASNLYDLFNGAHSGVIFHDITVGNNSVPCSSGSPNCQKNAAGNFFLTGYDTAAGYDLATGIGSVDATQLITYWGTASGNGPTTVTVQPSASTISSSDPVNIVATVAGSATLGNPTGTVTLTGGGYTSPAQNLAASGSDSATYTFNVPAGTFAVGSDTLTVTYSGDAKYSSQTGTAPLTVTGLTPTVTIAPSSTTINSGQSFTVTATVTGTGAIPTGTVNLYQPHLRLLGTGTLDSTGKYIFTIPAFTFTTAGTVALDVQYLGDTAYGSATSTIVQINVTLSTFTLSAKDVTLTAGATSGNVSTVTVTPAGGYTGTLSLAATILSSPPGAVSAPTFTVVNPPAITDATPQTGTVTVATTVASAIRGNPGSAWFKAAGGTALAAFLFLFVPLGSRRNRRALSLMLVLIASAFTLAGCGGSGHSLSTPTVTVTPSKTTFSASTAITAGVSVSGGGSTQMPTGTVTVSGGGFTSTAISLSGGSASISIPANSLSVGSVTLTATYSGDTNFNGATGTASVTVNKPGTTPGAYTIQVTGTDSAHASVTATTTFTLTVN